MFRAGLVLLMTIAVLACPYQCAARSLVKSPVAQTKQGCSCCGKSCSSKAIVTDSTSDESRQEPVEGEDFCSCVCNGAISAMPTTVVAAVVNWIDCRDLVARLNCENSDQIAHAGPPVDESDDGLSPRLSMQSLLL